MFYYKRNAIISRAIRLSSIVMFHPLPPPVCPQERQRGIQILFCNATFTEARFQSLSGGRNPHRRRLPLRALSSSVPSVIPKTISPHTSQFDLLLLKHISLRHPARESPMFVHDPGRTAPLARTPCGGRPALWNPLPNPDIQRIGCRPHQVGTDIIIVRIVQDLQPSS